MHITPGEIAIIGVAGTIVAGAVAQIISGRNAKRAAREISAAHRYAVDEQTKTANLDRLFQPRLSAVVNVLDRLRAVTAADSHVMKYASDRSELDQARRELSALRSAVVAARIVLEGAGIDTALQDVEVCLTRIRLSLLSRKPGGEPSDPAIDKDWQNAYEFDVVQLTYSEAPLVDAAKAILGVRG